MRRALLQSHLLTDRQRANLSYWIYKQNLENRRFDDSATGPPPVVDQAWVESHRDRTPLASDRMLMFLRELIRCDDAGEEPNGNLQKAAGGCRNDEDLGEMVRHAMEQGWTGNRDPHALNPRMDRINFPARIYVDEQLGKQGQERQGFVAMSFDPALMYVYEEGIAPAIRAAGYEPRLIKDKHFTGGVMDEIMAEIRKSKFVVADFTACKECTDAQPCKNDAPGGVYCEAGFALGLDMPVFLTCREPCAQTLHFDIDHLNRIQWPTLAELRCRLKNRIEGVLGHGSPSPSNGDQEVVGSHSSLAAEPSSRQ